MAGSSLSAYKCAQNLPEQRVAVVRTAHATHAAGRAAAAVGAVVGAAEEEEEARERDEREEQIAGECRKAALLLTLGH